MSEQSAKSFLKLLERSGIVAENRLKKELSKLSDKADGRVVNVSELSGHLVESGLITKWHAEKLLAGKYKGFFLGKYKLLGHLGTGGMSSVYLAQHRISDQLRAIKVLPRKKVADKSYLDRFYLEARAAASLSHPNVVRIYDICNEENTHYMVMEYVLGKDLYEIVKDNGPLDFELAATYTAQAAEGLVHAHNRDLVHRDIKPANLLKAKDGEVKILDLGLALVNQDDDASLTVLYNEKVMGTADYLSPEQAVNSHEVDLRADVYSLGCTLYYLLTGHPPFPKGTLAQRIAMHQTQEPADIRESRPDTPQPLIDICKKMMRKNAAERHQSCAEIKSELLSFVETGVLSDGAQVVADTNAQTSPFQIETESVKSNSTKSSSESSKLSSKSAKASSKSGKSKKQKTDSPSGAYPARRLRKPPPKWFLPVSVVLMFIILVAVLSIVSHLISK